MQTKTYWQHYNPVKIITGSVENLANFATISNALIVTSPGMVRRGVAKKVSEGLNSKKVDIWSETKPNPDLVDLDQAASNFRGKNLDTIIGLGGGSALDAAKAFAYLLSPSSANVTLSEVLRQGNRPKIIKPCRLIAIPTTSGTGSEVTPFATIWDHELQYKHSLSGEFIYPEIAYLDASLTLTLDYENTLYPALDTISHALESLWNKGRTPISEAYSLRALEITLDALPAALESPSNILFRTQLQEASTISGLAISQTRTAIAHAISYPLTLRHSMPHGLACSFTLPRLIDLYFENSSGTYERKLLLAIQSLLTDLNLSDLAKKYINHTDALSQLDNMFNPERADNCIFPINRSIVNKIINEALR